MMNQKWKMTSGNQDIRRGEWESGTAISGHQSIRQSDLTSSTI